VIWPAHSNHWRRIILKRGLVGNKKRVVKSSRRNRSRPLRDARRFWGGDDGHGIRGKVTLTKIVLISLLLANAIIRAFNESSRQLFYF